MGCDSVPGDESSSPMDRLRDAAANATPIFADLELRPFGGVGVGGAAPLPASSAGALRWNMRRQFIHGLKRLRLPLSNGPAQRKHDQLIMTFAPDTAGVDCQVWPSLAGRRCHENKPRTKQRAP